jgi:hypothetical protein
MSERDDYGRPRASRRLPDETQLVDPMAQSPVGGQQYAAPVPAAQAPRPSGRVIDASRLWAGGVLAGVVAAGVAIVGLLVARGVLDIPVLLERKGALVNPGTWWYAGMAFLAAIAATALLHALLAGAPQPYRFFGWIAALATAIAVLLPLTSGARLPTQLAVAVINLAIGAAIGTIMSSVGRSAARVLDEPYRY